MHKIEENIFEQTKNSCDQILALTSQTSQMSVDEDFLAIEPVGSCNLNCYYCYSNRNQAILNPEDLINFVRKHNQIIGKMEIYWVGRGEVTLYPHLVFVVNKIMEEMPEVRHIFQTNGVDISPYYQMNRPDLIERFQFSVDGLQKEHDFNRGKGQFNKLMKNMDQIYQLGTNFMIRSLLVPKNIKKIPKFIEYMTKRFPRADISFTFPVGKTSMYLYQTNTEEFRAPPLIQKDLALINREIKKLGDMVYSRLWYGYSLERYLSISSDGKVYTCDDSLSFIGDIHEDVKILLERLYDDKYCKSCGFHENCFNKIHYYDDPRFN